MLKSSIEISLVFFFWMLSLLPKLCLHQSETSLWKSLKLQKINTPPMKQLTQRYTYLNATIQLTDAPKTSFSFGA